MKPAILPLSALVLFSFVPLATADVGILGDTVVIHTNGDPGVSALGNPLTRVALGSTCFDPYFHYEAGCVAVYGSPSGAEYQVQAAAGPCGGGDECAWVAIGIPTGQWVEVPLFVYESPPTVFSCSFGCFLVQTDPLCIADSTVGPIICET